MAAAKDHRLPLDNDPRPRNSLFPDTSWGLVLAARDRSGADAFSSLPAPHVAISLPRSALQRLVGNYAHDELAATVALHDDKLTAQLAGQPAFEIFAESPTRFFLKVVDATLDFAPGEAPPASMILHQGGEDIPFKRKS